MSFAGKVCVVTGASSGIGRRTALDLAEDGARLCLAARREDRLRALAANLGGEAKGHSYVVTDVSNREQVHALAAHVKSTYGRCDVLVNNAGFSDNCPFDNPGAIDNLERVMATNFYGAVYATGELMPLLLQSAPSHVVNVASMAGKLAFRGASSYCASKFALAGWSEALHFELAERDVHVGVVEPGFIPTEGFPQKAFLNSPLLRLALGSEEGVSRAIRDCIEGKKLERIVPRWYYLLTLPRVVAPGVYRSATRRLGRSRVAARVTETGD